jgi:hypothetical protein
MTELPQLDRVFFPYGDGEGADHPTGSCCLSLNREFYDTAAGKWTALRDQHLLAFSMLVEQVQGDDSGYALTRPLVFEAHHVSELALKARTLQFDPRSNTNLPPAGHHLGQLLAAERALNGARSDSSGWEDSFVSMLDRASEAGRYPVAVRGEALHDDWCCVDAEALNDAVLTFLDLLAEPQ